MTHEEARDKLCPLFRAALISTAPFTCDTKRACEYVENSVLQQCKGKWCMMFRDGECRRGKE